MNARRFFTVLVCGFLFWGISYAQEKAEKSRVMGELSGLFLDYNGLMNGNFTDFRSYNPGITLAGHVDAGRWLDASLYSSFAPEVQYPLNREDIITTSLVDVRAMARIKFMRPDALIAPYISTGFGFNIASGNLRTYIPGGLGVRLQLSENFALMVEGMYRQPLDQTQIQPLAYSAGFVFGIPKKRPQEEKPLTDPQPDNKDLLADADNDGVPDIDDSCPDQKGKALNFGCPDTYMASTTEDYPVDNSTTTEPEFEEPVTTAPAVIIPESDPVDSYASEDEFSAPSASEELKPVVITAEMSSSKMDFIREAGMRINFAAGSSTLNAEAMAILDEVADILTEYPTYHLQVMGYSDPAGSADANKILSVQRGFAIKKYLVYTRGIRYARIYSDGRGAVVGFGTDNSQAELIPVAPGDRGYRSE